MKELYDSRSLETMRAAENTRHQKVDRLQELKYFAQASGVNRLGIAYCVSVLKQAKVAIDYLSTDFELYAIDCKCGKIDKSELFNDGSSGISCNPAGQAKYLNEAETELNVTMGLCMGHDVIFCQQSQAPITNILVKDRVNKTDSSLTFKK